MNGQLLIRKTGQTDKSGRNIVVLLAVVAFASEDEDLYKDGYKYDLLDVIAKNGEDYRELNNSNSPDDLLAEKIWKILK